LHELNVGVNKARAGVEDVVRSPHLGELRRLKLNKNEAGDGLAAAVAEAQPFPHLRLLDLAENGIGPEGARRLARIGWLRQLEALHLTGNPIGDEGVEALASSEVWASQRRLDLRDCELTPASARRIAACRHLRGLRELYLEMQGTGEESVVGDLARSPSLHKLRALEVRGKHDLSEADADALVRSPMAPNLRRLRTRARSRAAQRTLISAESLGGLTYLWIMGDLGSPGDASLGELVRQATHLRNLTSLTLDACRLSNEGVAALADSPHLARLTYLDLGGNGITTPGAQALLKSPHLNAVRYLDVDWHGKVNRSTVLALRERFGSVH
jgi:hypothetical protein